MPGYGKVYKEWGKSSVRRKNKRGSVLKLAHSRKQITEEWKEK